MRNLLATTCLTPLALMASPLAAETVIGAARTTPVRTSTANNGAADSIRISSAGTITVTSGTAVTMDSANGVSNEGAIQISNADDAIGIGTAAGASGAISNSGRITIDETYAPTDVDKDGDLDGALAAGARRFGIRTAGVFSGSITNTGTIAIEGNDSAGIALGGALTGTFVNNGGVAVVGDRSTGIALGDVSGAVRVAGSVTAQGRDATGVRIRGNLGGALVLQGTVSSTGYRNTTAPADTSKLDGDDLLQGGPAVVIAGDVAGGVILAVPPRDASATDADEDKDGIEDAREGSASITSFGSAAGLEVGAVDRTVTLGAVAGSGSTHGLIIDGTVTGNGVYAGVTGNGVVIGGLGGAVSLSGGMTVNGTVGATANGANATGLRIGAGATVPEIRVSGTVGAAGGGQAGQLSRALVIDGNANATTIRNSGVIRATAAGAAGAATAIVDLSGSVRLIENSGAIQASGAATDSGRNVAIDVRANAIGATVRQTAVAATVTAPAIAGDVLFGSGADTLDLADGTLVGNVGFGTGANRLVLSGDAVMSGGAAFGSGTDSVGLSGSSVLAGTVDFGGGADSLTLDGTARFTGRLVNASALAVTVTGGRLDVGNAGPVAIGSLAVGTNGTLGITLDTTTRAATRYDVSGQATFGQGARLAVTLNGTANAEGRYVVVNAGSLTGATNITAERIALPFLFNSSIAAGTPANQIAIDIRRKSATELGFNRSEAAAYSAIYDALASDAKISGVMLAQVDGAGLVSAYRQMLPDHAGGAFEVVTSGSRATARMLQDAGAPFKDEGRWGYWAQQVAWGRAKSIGDTASYDVSGWGGAGGAEIKTVAGSFGLSLGYLAGRDSDGETNNSVSTDQYELGAYWRGSWGGLRTFARGSAALVNFSGSRTFKGSTGAEDISRSARSKWDGRLFSAAGGASYQLESGAFTLRPLVSIDYYRLTEDGHQEQGGGAGFDLTVDERESDELAGTAAVSVGLRWGDAERGWFRAEIEGGRRDIIGGRLGSTTARFGSGDAFTLAPEARTDGWLARLRASGGSETFTLGGEASAEEQQGRAAVAFRASLQIGF